LLRSRVRARSGVLLPVRGAGGVKRTAQRFRGARLSLPQLLIVASASALVSALIVISATAQTGPQRAVIAALRERHVIHAPAPAPAPATPAPAATAAQQPPAPAAAASDSSTSDAASAPPPTATAPAPSDTSNAGSQAADPSSDSGSGTSNAGTKPPPKRASKVKHVFVI